MNELFSEERPLLDLDVQFSFEVFEFIQQGNRPKKNFTEDKYEHYHSIVELIDACWAGDSKARPTMETVVQRIDDIIYEIEDPQSDFSPMTPKQKVKPRNPTAPIAIHREPSETTMVAPGELTWEILVSTTNIPVGSMISESEDLSGSF